MVTDQELRDTIAADATATALASAGDDAGCAARLAAILPPRVVSFHATDRTLYAAFPDPADAARFLGGLKAVAQGNPAVAQALSWLTPSEGGIDLGFAGVRSMLDEFAAGGAITAAARDLVKSLAERPALVAADDVSRAMLPARPEGRIQP